MATTEEFVASFFAPLELSKKGKNLVDVFIYSL
jgi:hypothetical protein